MSIDRSQVPLMPNVQPQVTRVAERLEYRRLLTMAMALVVAGLAGWLYLRQASTVAAYWYDIGQLEARRTELRHDIQHLQSVAAQKVSLAELEASARTAGYRRPIIGEELAKIEVVIEGTGTAKPQTEFTRTTAPAEEPNPIKRLWQRFQAWLHAEPGT